MTAHVLDLTPFQNAIARIKEGLARYRRDTTDDQIRDGLIQRFEFTYESSHKILKRYLQAISPTPEAYDRMAFADLIRSANEHDLLRGDWPVWRRYREMRQESVRLMGIVAKKWEIVGIFSQIRGEYWSIQREFAENRHRFPAFAADSAKSGRLLITSHTYDEETALAVVEGIPDFLIEARFLCHRLEQRISGIEDD